MSFSRAELERSLYTWGAAPCVQEKLKPLGRAHKPWSIPAVTSPAGLPASHCRFSAVLPVAHSWAGQVAPSASSAQKVPRFSRLPETPTPSSEPCSPTHPQGALLTRPRRAGCSTSCTRRVRPPASRLWGVRPVCRNVTPSWLGGRVLCVIVWLLIHLSYWTLSPLGEGKDVASSLCVHSLSPGPGACSGLRDCPVACWGWGVTSRQQWRWWDWRDGPRLPPGREPLSCSSRRPLQPRVLQLRCGSVRGLQEEVSDQRHNRGAEEGSGGRPSDVSGLFPLGLW